MKSPHAKSGTWVLSGIGWSTEIPEFDPPDDLPDREICQLLPWTEDGFLPMEGENQIAEDVGPDPPFLDDSSASYRAGARKHLQIT